MNGGTPISEVSGPPPSRTRRSTRDGWAWAMRSVQRFPIEPPTTHAWSTPNASRISRSSSAVTVLYARPEKSTGELRVSPGRSSR